jgi:hypothetical protein
MNKKSAIFKLDDIKPPSTLPLIWQINKNIEISLMELDSTSNESLLQGT